jgi:hypothetical protein
MSFVGELTGCASLRDGVGQVPAPRSTTFRSRPARVGRATRLRSPAAAGVRAILFQHADPLPERVHTASGRK